MGVTVRREFSFFITPAALIDDERVSLKGILVYTALARRADQGGESYPSIASIAAAARLGPTATKEGIAELERLGYLRKTSRVKEDGAQTSSLYTLIAQRGTASSEGAQSPGDGGGVATEGGPQSPGDGGRGRQATTKKIHLEEDPDEEELPAAAGSAPLFEGTPEPPPRSPSAPDSLYRAVWESCLAMSGDKFSNYKREGEGCKRFCGLVRARAPTNPERTAKELLELFRRLRETGGKFWAGQPFTPSVLASAAIFDRLLTEHQRGATATDTKWLDELERRDA